MDCTVEKLINNGNWVWPEDWIEKFPVLRNIQVPILHNDVHDRAMWETNSGFRTKFNTKTVWKDLCTNGNEVKWKDVVWFAQSIPKQSFVLWMAIQGRLMTQDRLSAWKHNDDMKCAFCKIEKDSHEHLFFSCTYTKNVWVEMQKYTDKNFSSEWHEIIEEFSKLKANKNIWSIMRRLVLAATVYFVWQERNARIFKKSDRTEEGLVQNILDSIKWRVMSFIVKDSENVRTVEAKWNISLKRINK